MVPDMGMAGIFAVPERRDYCGIFCRQLYPRLDHPRMVQEAVMIVREERIGDCRLILGDCLKVMPMLGRVDAILTDPPFSERTHRP